MRGFWRRLRAPAVAPAGLGWAPDGRRTASSRPSEQHLRAAKAPATTASFAEPRCLPAPILVAVPDPAARQALDVALRAEQVLATVASAVDLLQARMTELEAIVARSAEAEAAAAADEPAPEPVETPTVEDLRLVRAQTARVAAELARLNIELRADLTAVADRVRPGSTPTVAAAVASRRNGNAKSNGASAEPVVDLRTWVGPDPASLKAEAQPWATRR